MKKHWLMATFGWSVVAIVLILPVRASEPLIAVKGLATYYDYRPGQAAAGPALRRALGPDWRGAIVEVTRGDRHVTVRLTDFCACGDRHGEPTIIDLHRSDFAQLAPTSAGVIHVVVKSGDIELPATDMVAGVEAEWTEPTPAQFWVFWLAILTGYVVFTRMIRGKIR